MSKDTSSGDGEEPPSNSLHALKYFRSAGRGFWSNVPDSDWNDWKWQLRNRITTLEQLERFLPTLTPEERAGTILSNSKLAMAIPPYFFNLIDLADENCPIRRQVIPRIEEINTAAWEMTDPCGEDSHSPVPGLVHRYPDRVLFLVTDRCAAYCRYCTRSRLVSNATGYDFHPQFDKQIDYIRRTRTVRDVLLSGGDPLLFNDEKLEYLLNRLRAIPHVEFLRIGTRIPIFLPQRITPELGAMLRKYHPLFLSVHSNHPRELTTEVREALGRLADAGLPLGNQSVLLRHVNDDPLVMRAHLQKLLMCRVRPYYIYQCDLIAGSAHLRTSVRKGLKVMEALRGYTTGYAVPQYVIDAPGGGGKVPVNPEYVLSHNADRVVIRNFEGKVFEYPEAADGTPLINARMRIEDPSWCNCWSEKLISGHLELAAGTNAMMVNPTLLVEAPSDSTEAYDRGKKFEHYRKFPPCANTCWPARGNRGLSSFSVNRAVGFLMKLWEETPTLGYRHDLSPGHLLNFLPTLTSFPQPCESLFRLPCGRDNPRKLSRITFHASRPPMPPESSAAKTARTQKIIAGLRAAYPDAHCELNYSNPLELLIATILSAQCTDKRVNLVTAGLFKRYRTAADYAKASSAELEQEIKTTGFFRNKAKSIQSCCAALVEKHGGQVPRTMEELVQLGGVGRKTANVVLGNAFEIDEGIVVDTHVARLSHRIGLAKRNTPEKIETDLQRLVPHSEWTLFSHLLIWHGRRRCYARNPDCPNCEVQNLCPKIGVSKKLG